MKKIALFLMAAFAVMACQKETFVPHVDFPAAEVTIPTAGTEELAEPIYATFTANAAWTAALTGEGVAEWLSISPKSGEAGVAKIKIDATANTGKENRTAAIVVTVEGLDPIQIPVVQLQKNAIDVNADAAYTVSFKGGSVEIEVGHNVAYTYEVSADWLVETKAYTTDKLTFTVAEQEVKAPARTATVTVYSELGVVMIVSITQEAWSPIVWSYSLTELGATAGRVAVGAFGDYVAFTANGEAFLADAATGSGVQKVPLPEGFVAGGVHVDDAGNLMVSGPDVPWGDQSLLLFKVDPATFTPTPMIEYASANFYGTEMGNFRVKGDITKDALIAAYVCDGGGHALLWEVKDGAVAALPYIDLGDGSWDASTGVVAPAGASLADGLFAITYGSPWAYNLYYYDGAEWTMTWESPATWMENFNCISTTEIGGKKYLALTMSCHFDYDYTDIVILDVTDPKAAVEVFNIQMNYHTLNGGGLTYSDIFIKEEGGMLAAYVIDPWMDAVEKYLFPIQ